MPTRRTPAVSAARSLVLGLIVMAVAMAGLSAPASGGVAPSEPQLRTDTEPGGRTFGADTNPLAGRTWGVYKGGLDEAWGPYARSSGTQRQLLAKIALRSKALWFTPRLGPDRIRGFIRQYIDNSQHGDPEALVSMTIFGIRPWAHREVCDRVSNTAERAAYKHWIDLIAREIKGAHVMLVVQPDAPLVMCSPNPSVPLSLMRYAAKTFSALPHTNVYVETGAADWLKDDPKRALDILIPGGVKYARGFALNSTHYDSTRRQILFSAAISKALAAKGITGKHSVINTAANGKPFEGYTYRGGDYDNARVCGSKTESRCVTLGIPPTSDVANAKWGMSERVRDLALKYVDGYVWLGRPWLYRQANPFTMSRALAVARTTPFG
jgi:endoglucanase